MERQNINKKHQESLSMHERLALKVTNFVGSMTCAYIFCILALISLPAALASGSILVIDAWVAQTFLQLVLLSIIMVGQNLQQRHAAMVAEEDYRVDIQNNKKIDNLTEMTERILHFAEGDTNGSN